MTFQGDAYTGWEAQPGAPNENITGHNLQTSWSHSWADGSAMQVLAYYDHTSRSTPDNGTFQLDQFDLEVQYSFALGADNKMVVGGGLRVSPYHIYGTDGLFFAPASRTLDLGDVFAQDSITLTPALTAILGLKLEADPYSGLEPLPTARLSWKASDDILLWAAVSRAIRSPTPFDVDVAETRRDSGSAQWRPRLRVRQTDGLRNRNADAARSAYFVLAVGILQRL